MMELLKILLALVLLFIPAITSAQLFNKSFLDEEFKIYTKAANTIKYDRHWRISQDYKKYGYSKQESSPMEKLLMDYTFPPLHNEISTLIDFSNSVIQCGIGTNYKKSYKDSQIKDIETLSYCDSKIYLKINYHSIWQINFFGQNDISEDKDSEEMTILSMMRKYLDVSYSPELRQLTFSKGHTALAYFDGQSWKFISDQFKKAIQYLPFTVDEEIWTAFDSIIR